MAKLGGFQSLKRRIGHPHRHLVLHQAVLYDKKAVRRSVSVTNRLFNLSHPHGSERRDGRIQVRRKDYTLVKLSISLYGSKTVNDVVINGTNDGDPFDG